MHERIQDLIVQCTSTTRFSYEGRGGGYDAEYFDKAKFAELVVKECAEVGLGSVEDGDDLDAIMRRVHNNILKHFGVES